MHARLIQIEEKKLSFFFVFLQGFADRRGMDTFPAVELAINVRSVTATNVATKVSIK